MEEWNDKKYFEAKAYWTARLKEVLIPRDQSDEELDAMENALSDYEVN